MKSKTIKWWYLQLSSIILLSLGAISQSVAQDVLSFKNESPDIILKTIEAQSGIRFNYLREKLPQYPITCTVSGDAEEAIKSLAIILNRHIDKISDDNYTIATTPLINTKPVTPILHTQLIDLENGDPIIGATILIPSIDYGVVTDEYGKASIEGYLADNDIVEINYLGYDTREITILELKSIGLLGLKSKEHVLDDIVIKSYKRMSTTKLTGDVIDPKTIELPAAPDRDAFSQAQMIPGVYNSSESLSDLQIRGGPPDQVSYTWNNMRLFQNSLFYGRVSSVNPFMVDQVNITRNGASADEGASASGAINLTSDLATIDTTSVMAHINGLYGNIGGETALFSNRLKLRMAYRRSLNETFQTSIYDKYYENTFQFGRIPDIDFFNELFEVTEFVTVTPKFTFSDISLTSQIELGDESYIKGSIMNFGNEFTYNQEKEYSEALILDSLRINTKGQSLEWHQQITKSLSTTINWGASVYDYRFINTDDKNNLEEQYLYQNNTVDQTDVRAKVTWATPHYGVVAGYDRYDWRVLYEAGSTREWEQWIETIEDANGKEHSGYINLSLHTHSWYRIMAGMRMSSYSLALLSRNIYEPRVHASMFLNDHLTLHAHYGKFHQNLNRRKFSTSLRADDGFWLLSNEGVTSSNYIPIVQTDQVSGGIRYRYNGWVFTADGYLKSGQDIWSSAFDFTSTEDLFEFTTLNIRGLELSAQYQNDWLSLMYTYDYVDDQMTTYNTELTFNSPFTQPHRLSMYQGIKWRNFSISSQFAYATGRYFSTPTGLDTFEKDGEVFNRAAYDSYFDRRVSDYYKLDLGVGYRHDFSRRSKRYIDFKIQLLNVLNRQNIIKNEYYLDYRFGDPEINLHRQIGLPFIFNFAVEVRL